MARPLVKKVVQQRIKGNKAIMQTEKKQVMGALTAATKGEPINAALTRTALSNFLKASQAVSVDTDKLNAA